MDPYEYIKRAIITGKYKSGLRLTEEFLANEIEVSRTPVREALKKLESDGLITIVNRRMTVREFTSEDVKQIYDLRSLLEGYAAKEAAKNRDEKDIEAMEQLVKEFEKLLKMDLGHDEIAQRLMDNNTEFHNALLKAAKNDHLHFHISKVIVLPLVFSSFYWYKRKDIERSYESHCKLLSSIKNGDADKALVSMQDHILTGRDFVLTNTEANDFFTKEEIS